MSEFPAKQDYGFVPVYSKAQYVNPNYGFAIRDTQAVLAIHGQDTPFRRITPNHGRSVVDGDFHVFHSEVLVDGMVKSVLGTSFSIKGADFSNPNITESPIEPSGMRINGLMDASLFWRVRKASELLVGAGVMCEQPAMQAIPKKLPRPFGLGGYTNQTGYKRDIYERHIVVKEPNVARGVAHALALLETDFGVMYRVHTTPWRLQDYRFLASLDPKENKGLDPADEIVRASVELLRKLSKRSGIFEEELSGLNERQDDFIESYMQDVLPRIMGANLAKMHAAGLWHKYLHPGNWSLAGEIMDLDSVKGEALGDEPINVFNLVYDIHHTLDTLEEIDPYTDDKHNSLVAFAEAYANTAEKLFTDPLALAYIEVVRLQVGNLRIEKNPEKLLLDRDDDYKQKVTEASMFLNIHVLQTNANGQVTEGRTYMPSPEDLNDDNAEAGLLFEVFHRRHKEWIKERVLSSIESFIKDNPDTTGLYDFLVDIAEAEMITLFQNCVLVRDYAKKNKRAVDKKTVEDMFQSFS